MRLQLITALFLFVARTAQAPAQELPEQARYQLQPETTTDGVKPDTTNFDRSIDVNFLFSYYDQDGNHSAVTGGLGTEELRDYSTLISVNVPLDSQTSITATAGMNYYTSASTDRINNTISSASSDDYRAQLHLGYSRFDSERNRGFGFRFGGSSETDYISLSFGFNWQTGSRDNNRNFTLDAELFHDTWMLIFPDELRSFRDEKATTDNRRSLRLALTYTQAITPRLQAALTTEFVYQNGLLSTPFHRAFFQNEPFPRVERLPEERFKLPIGLRVHFFPLDFLVTRLYYRFYIDSFGIVANTAMLEFPLKIGSFFTLIPFYRFHTQTAADHFATFAAHESSSNFWTSDFDLSAFNSHKAGIGLRYAPLFGLGRFMFPFSEKLTILRSLDIRYANYQREDGLDASIITLALSFAIQ